MRPQKNAKRGKVRKPAHEKWVPVTMTDAQEIALGLILWKSLRCHGALTGDKHGTPTDKSAHAGEEALRLARVAGVKKEFLELLFTLRLVRVEMRQME